MWQNGTVLDLGNLGGAINNIAFTIDNAGEVGGTSGLPGDQANHAFLWQNGVMTDLGVLPGDVESGALGVSGGQVVGGSFDANGNSRAFLWQNGVMTDLNDLISDGPPLFLLQASAINSEGQIAGFAFRTDTGEVHAFLATPNHENAPASQTGRIEPSLRVMLPENIRTLLQGRVRLGRIGSLAHHSQ